MIRLNQVWCCLFLFGLLVPVPVYAAAAIQISLNDEDGVYEPGADIIWTIKAVDVNAAAASAQYTLHRGGSVLVSEGTLDLSAGAQTVTGSLDKAGSLFLAVTIKQDGTKPLKKNSGVLIAPKEIMPSASVPEDFDAFWQAQLARQEAVPVNVQIEAEESVREGVESYLIRMDTIDGQHIYGRLAKPVGDKKCPALLIVQWAGVYGLNPNWALNQAANGWLVLNIIAHDIPVDRDEAYYNELKNGALKGYAHIGNDSRDTSYFLRMCLACSRAADYLATRAEWNGSDLVVTGGSQGGYQAFVTAGLNKKITAVLASVPAGCDHTAPLAGRAIGWPYWLAGDEKNEKKIEASRYYDGVNFSSRISCPVLIGMGLGDPTSRCEGIIAAANAMQGPVELVIMPHSNHRGPHNAYYARNAVWMEAIKNGQDLPVEKY